MRGQFLSHRQLLSEVYVGLIHDDDALETLDDLDDFVAVERVARGVVGRTEPYYLRVLVAGCQQFLCMQLEVLVKQNLTALDVVDVGTHLVHAVGGCDAHYVVAPWLAENAEGQVDGLVAAVAEEDVLGRHALDLLQHGFQFTLQGVGIAVVGCVVRILVGIEKHVCLLARVLVTG